MLDNLLEQKTLTESDIEKLAGASQEEYTGQEFRGHKHGVPFGEVGKVKEFLLSLNGVTTSRTKVTPLVWKGPDGRRCEFSHHRSEGNANLCASISLIGQCSGLDALHFIQKIVHQFPVCLILDYDASTFYKLEEFEKRVNDGWSPYADLD